MTLRLRSTLFSTLPIAIALASCTKAAAPVAPGAVMLGMTTDLEVPEDVSSVGLHIESDGSVVHSEVYVVKVVPGADSKQRRIVRLPATFAVKAPSDPNAKQKTMRARVVAYKDETGGKPVVLRQSITTIPKNRVALLRMPLQWINRIPASVSSVATTRSNGLGLLVSPLDVADGCNPETETRIDGKCASAKVAEEDLVTCEGNCEALVAPAATDSAGTGQNEKCFSTPECFPADRVSVKVIAADQLDCSSGSCEVFSTAVGPSTDLAKDPVNFALKIPDGQGQCRNGRTDCYIPIPKNSDGSTGGWIQDPMTRVLRFPGWVGEQLKEPGYELLASLGCESFTPRLGLCKPDAPGRVRFTASSDPGQPRDDGGRPIDGGKETDAGTKTDGSIPIDGGPPSDVLFGFPEDGPTQLRVFGGKVYVAARGGKVVRISSSPPAMPMPMVELLVPAQAPPLDTGHYVMDAAFDSDAGGMTAIVILGEVLGTHVVVRREMNVYRDDLLTALPMAIQPTGQRMRNVALGPNFVWWASAPTNMMNGTATYAGSLPADIMNVTARGTASHYTAITVVDGGKPLARTYFAVNNAGTLSLYCEAFNANSPLNQLTPVAQFSTMPYAAAQIRDIRAHDSYIYFAVQLPGGTTEIHRIPDPVLPPTMQMPQLLGTVTLPSDPSLPPSQLAFDDKCVYAVDAPPAGMPGHIVCLPTVGPMGTMFPRAPIEIPSRGIAKPWSVAVDVAGMDGRIFVADVADKMPGSGFVGALLRPVVP